jgi:heat shock protein HtpX
VPTRPGEGVLPSRRAAAASASRSRAQHNGIAVNRPLAALLRAAPSIAQLLRLALSRTRELVADATALELTGDSQALIAALDKLERHHAGFPALPVASREEGTMRLFRSQSRDLGTRRRPAQHRLLTFKSK